MAATGMAAWRCWGVGLVAKNGYWFCCQCSICAIAKKKSFRVEKMEGKKKEWNGGSGFSSSFFFFEFKLSSNTPYDGGCLHLFCICPILMSVFSLRQQFVVCCVCLSIFSFLFSVSHSAFHPPHASVDAFLLILFPLLACSFCWFLSTVDGRAFTNSTYFSRRTIQICASEQSMYLYWVKDSLPDICNRQSDALMQFSECI